jgi:hypothetical protein
MAADRRADVSERDGRGLVQDHGKHPVCANPRKSVPLPFAGQPIALHIPRDGVLVPVELGAKRRAAIRSRVRNLSPSRRCKDDKWRVSLAAAGGSGIHLLR